MNKDIKQTPVDGYESGHTDFTEALAATTDDVRAAVEEIVTAAITAIATPDATCVLSIAGHSDRVDSGVDRETARAQELQSSTDRAQSAEAFIINAIKLGLDGAPDDLNDLSNFALLTRWSGAAVLKETDAALSETQRKRNRRVQIRAVSFMP